MSSRPSSGGPRLRRLNMGQVFIILAIVSTILTVFVFKSMVSQKSPVKAENTETKPLVVATQDLLPGEVVSAKSIKVVDWPENHYPDGNVFQSSDNLIGRAVKHEIFSGEPVFNPNLAGGQAQGGLPVVIPDGYRAMTILVSESKDVAGFIKPGDHVDIIGTFNFQIPESTQKAIAGKSGLLLQDNVDVTQTVLQDVKVLATAQQMYNKKDFMAQSVHSEGGNATKTAAASPSPKPSNSENSMKATVVSSVTLAVTPDQAEKLAYADAKARLTLSLRAYNDRTQPHLLGAISNDFFPLKDILNKVVDSSSGIGPGLNDAGMLPPDKMSSPPPAKTPPKSFAVTSTDVQLIEGTEKNSVSF